MKQIMTELMLVISNLGLLLIAFYMRHTYDYNDGSAGYMYAFVLFILYMDLCHL